LITDLLKLQELESHQATLNLQTIHLKPFIQNLAQSFEEKWADKGLNITVIYPKRRCCSRPIVLSAFFRNSSPMLASTDPDTVVLRATYEVNQIILP